MFQGMDYVYAVYQEKSFSKAAAKLYISQPSLSANIKRIEEHIGTPLFDRSVKPLRLTECGERYIDTCEKIREHVKRFQEYVIDAREMNAGRLSLGGSNMFLSWVIAEMMRDYSKKYPLVEMDLVEENVTELMQMLHSGKIDILIENKVFDKNEFDCVLYKAEHLLLAVPRSFQVNDRLSAYALDVESIRDESYLDDSVPAVPLAEFKDENFLMQKVENDTRQRADNILAKAGFAPKVLFELDQQMTAYNITLVGLGISFVSDTLVSHIPSGNGAVYYKLPGTEGHRNIWFYWKRGRYITRAMKEFLKMAPGREDE